MPSFESEFLTISTTVSWPTQFASNIKVRENQYRMQNYTNALAEQGTDDEQVQALLAVLLEE